MKFFFPVFIVIILFSNCTPKSDTVMSVSEIRCSGLDKPMGTAENPVFSWILESKSRGKSQSAYQIIVDSDEKMMMKKAFWNSGKIKSQNSESVIYDGPALESGKEYFWRVRVWDENNRSTPWSRKGAFITGLFDKKDWENAKWIGYEEIPGSMLLVPGVHGSGDNLGNIAAKRSPVPLIRQEFSLGRKVKKALVFISGLGHYELYVNGEKIGSHFLSPGWTDYRKTCFYNTFDVTENLREGLNCAGVIVGNGFYNISRERYRKLVIAYGAPRMIMKLQINYEDGTRDVILSDETWKTSLSPITFSSIYGGEDYDANLEQPGWNRPGFNDDSWKNVLVVREPEGALVPEKDYPVSVADTLDAARISFQKGSYVWDFAQNASGIIKVKISGKQGNTVTFIPGELLGNDSLPSQQASGEPYYFKYTLKGEDQEIWIPRFTYYGFRYVQAEGAVPAGSPNPKNLPVISELTFLHTRNSSPRVGTFSCSNELFNSIYTLIDWSIKSNLASVATDCPHREKLGWLEQTHLMGNSIKYVYDIHNLYDKIVGDMIDSQLHNGLVPDIAPEYVPFEGGFRDSPEWGSACIILPWDMYEWYGDVSAVRKAYPMMKKYLYYLKDKSEGNILTHGLGDWFDLGPQSPGEAQLTPKAVTATSVYYYDAKLLAKMAKIIGEDEDAAQFAGMAEEIRKDFNSRFYNHQTGVYSTGSQTAYSMPLFFGMPDDTCRSRVVKNLVESINENGKALTAGDIGYRYLLRVLEEEGRSQLIYEMNSKTEVPGYGYQLAKGATSLTESWAALRFVSNNHMMLGHLMEWFYSGLGGIRQDTGSHSYDRIIIAPEIVGDITRVEASCKSVHGEIMSSWKTGENSFTLKVKIPVNCTASIRIPSADPSKISENGIPVLHSEGIRKINTRDGKTFCEVGSGEYLFSAEFTR